MTEQYTRFPLGHLMEAGGQDDDEDTDAYGRPQIELTVPERVREFFVTAPESEDGGPLIVGLSKWQIKRLANMRGSITTDGNYTRLSLIRLDSEFQGVPTQIRGVADTVHPSGARDVDAFSRQVGELVFLRDDSGQWFFEAPTSAVTENTESVIQAGFRHIVTGAIKNAIEAQSRIDRA